jgi:hypothetical protein
MKHFSKLLPDRTFLLAASIGAGLLLSACSGSEEPVSTAATTIPTASVEISSETEDAPESADNAPVEPAATATSAENAPAAIKASPTTSPTEMTEAYPTRKPASAYADLEIITLLPPDAIPAINNPQFLSAKEADQFYDPDELVMGVSFNGDSRAYSAPFLSNHEIVNDTVGGVKIAVTW